MHQRLNCQFLLQKGPGKNPILEKQPPSFCLNGSPCKVCVPASAASKSAQHENYRFFQSGSVGLVALVNDTTGTMMSCALSNPYVSAGLILGTGTNACYMESLNNVPKWTGDCNDPREVIINTEWGAFGDNGSWNHLRTAFDEKVDKESINPGMQMQVCFYLCCNLNCNLFSDHSHLE